MNINIKAMIRSVGAFLASVCVVFASFVTSGCATTGDARGKLIAQLAVQYAVGKVLENNPTYAPRVAQIAAEVGAAAGNEASTVPLVMALVRGKIDFAKLSPADVTLVNALLTVVEAELTARIEGGVLSPDNAVKVREVAGWIEQAARAYVPSP